MKSIDAIRRPRPRPARPEPRFKQSAGPGARFSKFPTAKRRRVPWSLVLTILASPLLFGLSYVGVIGLAGMLVYGAAAWVLRWPSRDAFTMALLALLYMLGAQIAAVEDIARALATLAYALLAIGAILLARELKSARGVWFKKH